MKAISLLLVSCFISFTTVKAQQTATKPTRESYTLQQQFSGMKSRSSSYKEFNQDYKVIRVSYLDSFWKNVRDSLKAREHNIRQAGKVTEQALVKAKNDLNTQASQLQALKQENALKEQQIQKTSHDIASLSVFSLDINKQVYVILSWIAILALALLSGIFAFLYKKSKVVTDQKISAFEDLSKELKDHKQNAREREIKIKRELQTETNRVEELKQQIIQLNKQLPI